VLMICNLSMSRALAPPLLIFERRTLCQVLRNVMEFAIAPFWVQAQDQEWAIIHKEAVNPGCRSSGALADWLDLSMYLPAEQAALKMQPCLRSYTIDGKTYGKDECAWGYCSTVPNPSWDNAEVWRMCICDKYEVRP